MYKYDMLIKYAIMATVVIGLIMLCSKVSTRLDKTDKWESLADKLETLMLLLIIMLVINIFAPLVLSAPTFNLSGKWLDSGLQIQEQKSSNELDPNHRTTTVYEYEKMSRIELTGDMVSFYYPPQTLKDKIFAHPITQIVFKTRWPKKFTVEAPSPEIIEMLKDKTKTEIETYKLQY